MGFWSWLTDTTPQAEQQANLDTEEARYRAARDRRISEGTLSVVDQNNDLSNVTLEDTTAAAQQGFVEGAHQGLNNVLSAPGQAVGAVGGGAGKLLGGIIKNVPWWLWLAAAAALFWYVGGGVWLLRKSRGLLSK